MSCFFEPNVKKFEIQIFYPVVPNRSNIIIISNYFKAVKLTDRMMFVCAALEMQTQLEWVCLRAIERHAPHDEGSSRVTC